MKIKIGTLTKIRTGKLDANASSEDGQYPFFTCSREALRILVIRTIVNVFWLLVMVI